MTPRTRHNLRAAVARVSLFARIVFRVWDALPDGTVIRLWPATAWDVAARVHPFWREERARYRRRLACHGEVSHG